MDDPTLKLDQKNGQEPVNPLAEFLAGHPRVLAASWIFAVAFLFSSLPVGYITWFDGLVSIWSWAQHVWWHVYLAVLGSFALLVAPLLVLLLAGTFATFLAKTSLAASEGQVRKTRDALREAEREALERLEKSDQPGLLPLLKYSRAQLEAYYAVGLLQARRSFMNGAVAMWIGFVVLVAGVAYQVLFPVLSATYTHLGEPSNVKQLTLGSGAIIEFISAAFLWVYRSATVQMTNFYNRQMHTHASILSFRISATMEEPRERDHVKALIVQSILAGPAAIEMPKLDRRKGRVDGMMRNKKRPRAAGEAAHTTSKG